MINEIFFLEKFKEVNRNPLGSEIDKTVLKIAFIQFKKAF